MDTVAPRPTSPHRSSHVNVGPAIVAGVFVSGAFVVRRRLCGCDDAVAVDHAAYAPSHGSKIGSAAPHRRPVRRDPGAHGADELAHRGLQRANKTVWMGKQEEEGHAIYSITRSSCGGGAHAGLFLLFS